ncbi:MAG: hypothetical protein PVI87_07205 [Gammaproteobacteria bacterium]|jgi:hypothetical protein
MSNVQPINESYWVEPGLLLAGEHPGHWEDAVMRRRMSRLLDAGIRLFVDLSGRGDTVRPYRPMLDRICSDRGIIAEYVNLPLPAEGVPEHAETVTDILGVIRDGLGRGARVYVHCSDGVQRTGMVMGCWLVERGLDPAESLEELARRFMAMSKSEMFRGTPTNASQLEWVENWEPQLDMKQLRTQAS